VKVQAVNEEHVTDSHVYFLQVLVL